MFFLQMSGFPGSGKSTLSRLIGREMNAVIIDHDVVKSALMDSMTEGTLDTKRVGGMAYEIEWTLIDFHLSQGHSVILDSPCLYPEMLVKGAKLAKNYNVKYKYIECFIDDFHEIDRRLRTRERKVSQIQQLPNDETFIHALAMSKRPQDIAWLRVDTSQEIRSYLGEALVYLRA